MARDLKPVKRRTPAGRKSRGGTLLGIFLGLVIGVGAALAVVWYMNATPAPFVPNKTQGPQDNGRAAAGTPPGATNPAPLPGKPGDPPVEKRFQFYDILPGKSEPKPDGSAEAKPDAKAASKTESKAETKAEGKAEDKPEAVKPHAAEVHLQAGSFQNSKDADNLKATLALSGMEANVQQVMVGDKVWFRVRLGPYRKPEDATRAKAELSKLGIEADLVKGKD